MVKQTQIIRRQQLTNCLSVLDHFVGLALKGLNLNGLEECLWALSRLTCNHFPPMEIYMKVR